MHATESDGDNEARSTNDAQRDWKKLYRAAILESNQSKLPQRISDAQCAILERSVSLARQPASHGKERDALTRALEMLGLLRSQS
jgi:hypothetical protein